MSNEDIPDPATGLTPKEKRIVRDTWAIVKKDMKGTAYELFFRFLSKYPSYQNLFTFKDVPISEIKGNKKVLAHGMNVLYALTALVDNLEDPECLVEMLTKMGGNHKQKGVNISMFGHLGEVIVELLKDALGPDVMNDEAVNAWTKTYSVITSVVNQGMGDK